MCACACSQGQSLLRNRKKQESSRNEMNSSSAAAATAAVAAAPASSALIRLRRAPVAARAPRRAGALPSVSPASSPVLRGLRVSLLEWSRRRVIERFERCGRLFLFFSLSF